MDKKLMKSLDWIKREYFYEGKSFEVYERELANPEKETEDSRKAGISTSFLLKYLRINEVEGVNVFDDIIDIKDQVISLISSNTQASEEELSMLVNAYTYIGAIAKGIESSSESSILYYSKKLLESLNENENLLAAIYDENNVPQTSDLTVLARTISERFDADIARLEQNVDFDSEDTLNILLDDDIKDKSIVDTANWWATHDEEDTRPYLYANAGQVYKKNRAW